MVEPVSGAILGGAKMTDRVIVPFEGPGAGVGELTWGQQKVWTLMYDPAQLDELRARVDRERGETIEISCAFNDRRLDVGIEPPGPAAPRTRSSC